MARKAKELFAYEIRSLGANVVYSYGLWYGTMRKFRLDILQGEYHLTKRKDIDATSDTGRRLIGLLLQDEVNEEHVMGDALDMLVTVALDLA